eukprot:542000-Pelagomonas_calceolata.AAC.1
MPSRIKKQIQGLIERDKKEGEMVQADLQGNDVEYMDRVFAASKEAASSEKKAFTIDKRLQVALPFRREAPVCGAIQQCAQADCKWILSRANASTPFNGLGRHLLLRDSASMNACIFDGA